VQAIDGMFGAHRNEQDTGAIHSAYRDEVCTLLSLLDQVPNELITVPFKEYVEYLRCQAALTSASADFDVQEIAGGVSPAKAVDGKDPVERIRRILATCPDEVPPPHPQLDFIPEASARASVEEDIRAAWIDFQAGEWKGATVFAANAVETMLFWVLKDRPDLKKAEGFDRLHLPQYVEEAGRLGIIGKRAVDQASLAIDGRNLLHAGKVARTGTACSKATALAALAALEFVMTDLLKRSGKQNP
jgi:hypothetical protein